MRHIISTLLLCITLTLISCANTSTHQPTLPDTIYLDNEFRNNIQLETPKQIFKITPTMRSYVKSRLLTIQGTASRTKRLIKDLFSEQQLNIDYAHNANYTASETFENKSANCLSLTILAYVLVKEADLTASFIDVEIAESWNQYNGISMLNGHVNLKVSAKKHPDITQVFDTNITIDFVPVINIPVISETILNKDEIVALYYNNKGGEALALRNYDVAYRYLSEATKFAPNNASIWGNLASLYRQKGYLAEAELIYDHVMLLAPDNLNLKENFALLYQHTNRTEQANAMIKEVQNRRQLNPFYQSMLAEERYYKNDYSNAIKYYKKAIRLNKFEHSFYFGLAKSFLMLNDFDSADKYLLKAKLISNGNKQKQKYQNKIEALKNIIAKVR